MTAPAPGYFELYAQARPALPAGRYSASAHHGLTAQPPHDPPVTVPVPDATYHVHIDAPRYVMPPDQILSTFPPAGSTGDWRERLPQIVLKRRTLPWERNPTPDSDPHSAPPWLALVVLADGEFQLSSDTDVGQCVTPGVQMGDDADVARGKYIQVSANVISKIFPAQTELELLCHVRKVDLSDTELALGDDDGFLAVVLSNRLPQPGPPDEHGDPTPRKYTACLINLENQVGALLANEPPSVPYFSSVAIDLLRAEEALPPAPSGDVDAIAMQSATSVSGVLGAAVTQSAASGAAHGTSGATARGVEVASAAWAAGPAPKAIRTNADSQVIRAQAAGYGSGIVRYVEAAYRYPVLVSWEFTCIGTGGFERLMDGLQVGLLGTVDAERPLNAPAMPDIAPTGHIALDQRTRHGESARAWYRGPLTPQPTVRAMPDSAGVLSLAQTSDDLRRVVPDGREDLSLAALFEIGRLLTLSKPALVAALMAWRRELFGAARAHNLATVLAGAVFATAADSAVGGRATIEALVRSSVVGAFTAADPAGLAPSAQLLTSARIPDHLVAPDHASLLAGLGLDPGLAAEVTRSLGLDGLATLAVPVAAARTIPVSQDQLSMTALRTQLGERVGELVASVLKADTPVTSIGTPVLAKGTGTQDALDRLIRNAGTEEG